MTALLNVPLCSVLVLGVLNVEAKTVRSRAEVVAFKRENPCPSIGLLRRACPGYQVDHIEPLCGRPIPALGQVVWP